MTRYDLPERPRTPIDRTVTLIGAAMVVVSLLFAAAMVAMCL